MWRVSRLDIFKIVSSLTGPVGRGSSGWSHHIHDIRPGPNRRQWASSYGINVIPYNKVQKYVENVDLRSAVQDNVAFKLSFGATFALAAFMHF